MSQVPKILVLSYSCSKILSYATLSEKINQSYCKKQGYDFIKETYDVTNWHPSYERLILIKKYLTKYDYILWIDSDACFINFDKKITDFLTDDKDLILAGNIIGYDLFGIKICPIVNGLPAGINTGVFILKNSTWSINLLELWIERCVVVSNKKSHPFWEQSVLQDILIENKLDIQNHTNLIVPAYKINREDTREFLTNKWDRCDFILHLWGSKDEFRVEVFSDILSGKRPKLHNNFELPYFKIPF